MNNSSPPQPELTLQERDLAMKAKEAELKQKERELELNAKEIELKQREIQLDLRQREQFRWHSPAFLAAIAFFGTAATAVFGYWTSVSQERARAQSALVLEAIKTPDSQTAAKNLKFFTDLGFLNDRDHKIRDYIAVNEAPTLPTFPSPPNLREEGVTVIDSRYQPVLDVQIELSDGSVCPRTGLDGFSKCPKAMGMNIKLSKPGYGTRGPFPCNSRQVFFDPGDR